VMRQRHQPKRASEVKNPNSPGSFPRLGSYVEAPDFLKVDFILSGYRLGYNLVLCLISLFQIHNETVNIWSHFGGTILYLWFSIKIVIDYLQYGYLHVFFPLLYTAGCIYALAASAIFHWFNCISSDHHKCLRTLDFGGIGVVIVATGAPITYYSLYCYPQFLYPILTIVGVLSPLLIFMPFLHAFHQSKFLRTLVYVTTSLIAFCDWMIISWKEGSSSPLQIKLFANVIPAYLCFALGLILYITRYPERLWPGAFDLLGTSHQIWHGLVLLGMWTIYNGLMNTVAYRVNSDTCQGL